MVEACQAGRGGSAYKIYTPLWQAKREVDRLWRGRPTYRVHRAAGGAAVWPLSRGCDACDRSIRCRCVSGTEQAVQSLGFADPAGALHEGTAIMAKQFVMNATGDTRYEFDPTDAAAVAKASMRFKELTGAGYTAAVRRGSGASELIRDFDPSADETVFLPRLRGG